MLPSPSPKEIDRKGRLAVPDTVLQLQDRNARRSNFDEVYLPFDAEQAVAAARRCIQCPKAPCAEACPLNNDIPLALWQLEHGEFEDAARVFRRTSTLPDVCGRVCPQIVLCEGSCIYVKKGRAPVAIGRLEAFAADYLKSHSGLPVEKDPPTGHRAAVVGAGPAGLTVAEVLALKGHNVTVYDAWPRAGGIMQYGIPKFKMTHRVCDEKAGYLAALGVEFVFGTRMGRDITIDDLLERGFETVFLGVGAGVATELKMGGVDLEGVYSATPFLIRANVDADKKPPELKAPPVVGNTVVVIGGGDTAMDCLRTSVRLGAKKVVCVYRRTEAEMPGNERDRALAKEEGVEFLWLTQPLRVVGDAGRVTAVECMKMELGEPDESGRRRPIPVEGSEFAMPVDTVVLALGYQPDPSIAETTPNLDTHDRGLITIDGRTGATSRENVFAGGDDVVGPDLVVTAVAQGRIAAASMHEYMMQR